MSFLRPVSCYLGSSHSSDTELGSFCADSVTRKTGLSCSRMVSYEKARYGDFITCLLMLRGRKSCEQSSILLDA